MKSITRLLNWLFPPNPFPITIGNPDNLDGWALPRKLVCPKCGTKRYTTKAASGYLVRTCECGHSWHDNYANS